ncbi:MAG: hypothetical protein J6T57_02235 [Alphaproteobacteria bacterium]|nr:hypothetical protein [Alphaproteobacteria bacterium]
MKDMNKTEKTNGILRTLATMGDTAIAAVSAPFVAAYRLRMDLLNPENIDRDIKYFKTYAHHFRAHMDHGNNNRLLNCAMARADERIAKSKKNQSTEYDISAEIHAKDLDAVIKGLSAQTIITVDYFEETEHQPRAPKRCLFREYAIDFATAGTKWCGGMSGTGYVFKRDGDENFVQIATISYDLSKFLSDIVNEKYTAQQKRLAADRLR